MNASSLLDRASARLKGLAQAITLLVAIVAMPLAAFADDVITLKNGTEMRGTIVRELDDLIFLEVNYGTLKKIELVTRSDIKSLVREDGTEASTAPVADTGYVPAEANTPAERRPGVPRAAVLSLEGTVGIQFAIEPIRRAIPLLEEAGVDILVLRINSGGGLLLEMLKLSDFVHNELKPKFRTVAWIRSAISAAAMTAHNCEEIYFYPEGNYGAATGWSGALNAMKGEGLMEVREFMELVSSRGGYDPRIMWSMQWDEGLSANIDQATGEITFYAGEEGEHIVCPVGRVLSWTASEADKWGLSKGTAKNLDELAAAMKLSEVEWIGEVRSGFAYPVSEAEDLMLEYRDRVTRDEERFGLYNRNYQMARAAAVGQADDATRAALVGRARKELQRLYSMGQNNPNFLLLNFNMTADEFKWWFRDQNDELDEIAAG